MSDLKTDCAAATDPSLILAARFAHHHRAIGRTDRNAREAEGRLAQVARASGLTLSAAIRGSHKDARMLRRAQMHARQSRRRRETLAAKLVATRASTSVGIRAKLLVALAMFDLEPLAVSLLRSAVTDLRASKIGASNSR